MNNKFYKCCAVPMCKSTSIATPEKLFIHMPRNEKIREIWLTLAFRDPTEITATSSTYFCEDHFDIENDMTNYIQFKMGFSQKIRMVDGVLPSKFHCQNGYRERQHDQDRQQEIQLYNTSPEELHTKETGVKIKTEEFDDEETLSAPETLECSEDIDDKVVLKPIKLENPWQKSDKETLTDPVATANKYVQATHRVHMNFRSKGGQKKIKTRDVSVSTIDIPTKTSYDYNIQGRSKSIIYKMYNYLMQEYRQMNKMYQGKLDLTPLSKVKKRMAEATGLSQQDLKRILEEEKEQTKYCKTPPKKRRRTYEEKKYCVHKCIECERGARAVNNDHNYHRKQPETEQNETDTTDPQASADDADVITEDKDYIEYNENEIHNSTCEGDPLNMENIFKEDDLFSYSYSPTMNCEIPVKYQLC